MSTSPYSLGIFELQIQLNGEGRVPVKHVFHEVHEHSLGDAMAASQQIIKTYPGHDFRQAFLRDPNKVIHNVLKLEAVQEASALA